MLILNGLGKHSAIKRKKIMKMLTKILYALGAYFEEKKILQFLKIMPKKLSYKNKYFYEQKPLVLFFFLIFDYQNYIIFITFPVHFLNLLFLRIK